MGQASETGSTKGGNSRVLLGSALALAVGLIGGFLFFGRGTTTTASDGSAVTSSETPGTASESTKEGSGSGSGLAGVVDPTRSGTGEAPNIDEGAAATQSAGQADTSSETTAGLDVAKILEGTAGPAEDDSTSSTTDAAAAAQATTSPPQTTSAPTTTAPPQTTSAPATTAAPTTAAPTTTAAPLATVSIGGGSTLAVGQSFSWPVSSTNAVSGTWSSSCGVSNPNWTPGQGWAGSYDGPPRGCTLTLTVVNSAGQSTSTTKSFSVVAAAPTVSIGGGNTLVIDQSFSWPVFSTNAVSGTWSSSCGVSNPNWSPGQGWGGSYGGPARTCTLSLTVVGSDGQTASTTKTFSIVDG